MTPDTYIPGLDDPQDAPETEESRFLDRMLAYGFPLWEVERCLEEIERYAKEGRRS